MAFYMNQAFDEFIVINPDAVQKMGVIYIFPGCR